MKFLGVISLLLSIWISESTVFFKEEFADGDGYLSRWIPSTSKGGDQGKFAITSGKFYGDVEKDKGLQTSQDARFYGISAKFDSFSNEGKDLVIQFQVKHEQNIDCGGGYVKVFASDLDQAGMHGDSPYHIMFGPDICGSGTKKVHVIFTHKGKNHLINKEIRCKDDEFTHLYTLIVKPDNTYEVKIDNAKVEGGSLETDWDILPAKEILDPEAKKPEDWDDNETIADPADEKPEDWDMPEHIADPEAKKPEDWDDEMDGEWEAAMIDNPEFKGEWKPKQIPNPAYKGQWIHPKIANPEYSAEPLLYRYGDISALGFDLWQVKSGTIFDNIFIGDDAAEADAFAKETFEVTKDAEKKMKDNQEEEEKAARDAEDAAKKDEEKPEDEDEDEEEEEDEEDAEEPEPQVGSEHDEL